MYRNTLGQELTSSEIFLTWNKELKKHESLMTMYLSVSDLFEVGSDEYTKLDTLLSELIDSSHATLKELKPLVYKAR